MSRGDGMPPQEQEPAMVCPRCGGGVDRIDPEMVCCRRCNNHTDTYEAQKAALPKPSPAVEEGPAGGEAGSRYTYLGSEVATSDEVRLPGYQIGYQRGLEVGEKGMRERVVAWLERELEEEKFHLPYSEKRVQSFEKALAGIRALPLSAADGPAPATEESDKDDLLEAAWGVIANAGEGSWERESRDWQTAAAAWRERWFRLIALPPGTPLQPASSSPTAEESHTMQSILDYGDFFERKEEERAALLACREALRTAIDQLHPDSVMTLRECQEALAVADMVVPR